MSGGEFRVGPIHDPDRFRLGPAVASGSEGVLYKGYLDVEGGPLEMAVKMLQPGHLGRISEWTTRWRNQLKLLRKVKISGLVTVRGGFVGPLPHPAGHADASTSSLYLLMDWIEGVPLDRWARSVEVAEPEQLLLALMPVAAALDLLHSGASTDGVPVVHGDVKPANILMRPGGDTVLVDVGSARGIVDGDRRSGIAGTPGYIAPEVPTDGHYSPAADRYALGAVAFAILTNAEPPPQATTEQLRCGLATVPLLANRPEMIEHVLAMLDADPDKRPTGLANWVAQLRRSSLVALPGDVALAPRAPGRGSAGNPSLAAPVSLPHRIRRPWLIVVALVAVVVAIGAIVSASPSAESDGATTSSSPPKAREPLANPQARVDGIRIGMTVEELQQRYGPPTGRYGASDNRFDITQEWVYKDDELLLQLLINEVGSVEYYSVTVRNSDLEIRTPLQACDNSSSSVVMNRTTLAELDQCFLNMLAPRGMDMRTGFVWGGSHADNWRNYMVGGSSWDGAISPENAAEVPNQQVDVPSQLEQDRLVSATWSLLEGAASDRSFLSADQYDALKARPEWSAYAKVRTFSTFAVTGPGLSSAILHPNKPQISTTLGT